LVVCLSACAPTIPALRAAEATPVPAGPVISPCVWISEQGLKPLAASVSGFAPGPWRFALVSILIPHPKGLLILDPAIGEHVLEDLDKAPTYFRLVVDDGQTAVPLTTLMAASGMPVSRIKYAAITHAHWDHTGALRELPDTEVWLSKTEADWALAMTNEYEHGTLPHQLKLVESRLRPFGFDGPAYEGFAASKDLFGDGSLIAVPLPGHTPGSTGYFLNSGDGRRWLFVGDTAWAMEGIRRPAHKPGPVRGLVDYDVGQLSQSLGMLHAISVERQDLKLIPSHDEKALRAIPVCTRERLAPFIAAPKP
jgi:N-acyl homoserine lactone hydrolase